MADRNYYDVIKVFFTYMYVDIDNGLNEILLVFIIITKIL